MKFWQKAFIGMLAVFIISINICLYLTSRYSFSLNMKSDMDRASGEYHFVINSVNETMNSIFYRDGTMPAPASIRSVMRPYADYYKKQNVYFKLQHSGDTVFTNIPVSAAAGMKSTEAGSDGYTIKVLPGGGINYLYISGKIGGQFEDYTLTYVRDLSELYNTHAGLTRYLITVSLLVETMLAAILFLILRRLTRPIKTMQEAANKIAGGVYDGRINIPGKDEFHDLAENFNRMASSIQDKINELDKNSQDKQRLIDNLAHELRTPLTAIRGYAEFLQNASTNEQNRIIAAGYIVSEIDRMKNLAFKLLDLALVRNGGLDIGEISPLELLNQIKVATESKLKEKSIKLNVRCSLHRLTGDTVLLQSLLINLVDNAVKASDADTEIELSAYIDTVPILEVRDPGCGMEEEQTELICEPFYRVDKARSRSSGGVGLGLSLCSEIARLHGADLRISSQPGKGTTVKVIFTTPLQLSENSMILEDV